MSVWAGVMYGDIGFGSSITGATLDRLLKLQADVEERIDHLSSTGSAITSEAAQAALEAVRDELSSIRGDIFAEIEGKIVGAVAAVRGDVSSELDTLGKIALEISAMANDLSSKASASGLADTENTVTNLSSLIVELRSMKLDAVFAVFANESEAVSAFAPNTWAVAEIAGRLSLWAKRGGTLVDLRAGLVTTSSLDA